MDGVSVGLNWYLNTNLTVNTEWVYNSRYDLPNNAVVGRHQRLRHSRAVVLLTRGPNYPTLSTGDNKP